MAVSKIRPVLSPLGRIRELDHADLLQSVRQSILSARRQVSRSLTIVSHSRRLMDRTKTALSRANEIRCHIAPPARNPWIEPADRVPPVEA